jgi:hypothetical protein
MNKITSENVAKAIAVMKDTIPFFPKQVLALEIVQRSIESFVSTGEQLEWLTHIACNTMRQWSLPELRGIFCSRFQPADGIWASAETPGFTPDEALTAAESAYHEREAKEYERKLAEWKEEAKLLGAAPEPFEIPPAAVKVIPALPAPEKPAKQGPSLREAEEQLEQQLTQIRRRSAEESARLIADLERQLAAKKREGDEEGGKKKWLN